jgi:outer membrane receptor for ferrienterochelin and colicins
MPLLDRRRALSVLALLTVSAVAQAQQLPTLTLEELMRIDAGRVFGASERMQPVTEAPASVSFVTAEDIARFGYRSLADILRSVRGMYVTDDRNFGYLGARGFAKPGDYNSRILLLVNGHRVNDNVFGQAEIGPEFGMDPAIFERVEIIRGPASALYGDSAFFAVVNVITRTGASIGGASVTVEGGSLGTARSRVIIGQRLANGLDVALSATGERSAGVERLYFPAYDAPATHNGIAEGLDGERLVQYYGRVNFKDVTLTTAFGHRRKQIPTASFFTVFNEQESPERTTDRHALVDAEYTRSIAGGRLVSRASYDRFSVDGIYPFRSPDVGVSSIVGDNRVLGVRWSAGAWLTRPLPGRQVLTTGAEFIDNLHQDQSVRYDDPAAAGFIENQASIQHAVYAQDEAKVSSWLILNGGIRYDHYEDFSRVTPRAAVIVMPSQTQSFKYLFGSAFRAPNAYELNAFYFGDTHLLPESIDTHELVWERYSSDWLRTSVSTYWYAANRLITLVPDASALLGAVYVNVGRVRARGLELEGQMRIKGGGQALISYAQQSVTDEETHKGLANSPRHVLKGRVSVRGLTAQSSIGFETQYLSSRATLAGNRLPPATVANLTIVQPIGTTLELSATARNLFDERYADPGSDQHLQDSIPQNGRTFRIGITFKIPSK